MNIRKILTDNIPLFAIASLTLGLAPFVPEPHIWKQILNIYHGRLTESIDFIDLLMHGAPWMLLIISVILKLTDKKKA